MERNVGMIHSVRLMPTGNFVDTDLPAVPPPVAPVRTSRWPCDYYSAPLSDVRPFFPRWVPYGCGGAAALFVVLLLIAGALLSGERIKGLLDFVIGTTLGEMKSMYAADIPPAQKAEFDTEVKRMRESLREGKIGVQKVQPFFQAMQKVIADDKVDAGELRTLTDTARKAGVPGPK